MPKKKPSAFLLNRHVEHDLDWFREWYTDTSHRRLSIFISKGCYCHECGLEASKIVFWSDWNNPLGVHHDLVIVLDDGKEMLLTIDHIHPRSKGGTNHPSNLRPLCERCNSRKADKIYES